MISCRLTEDVVHAIADLQSALVAREAARRWFRCAGYGRVGALALANIPHAVRTASQRVTDARLALDKALLDQA